MPNIRTFKSSFVGGEISPEMFGRLDIDKEQNGLALCRNFIVTPHGPVKRRGGTHYAGTVKTPANKTRVIPFSFNNTQTLAIEMGSGYFRFWNNQAPFTISISSESLINPDFNSPLATGWTNGSTGVGTATVSAGQLLLTGAGSSDRGDAYQVITTVIGVKYTVIIDCVSTSLSDLFVSLSYGGGSIIAPSLTTGVNGYTFTATGTSTYIRVSTRSAAVINAVRVRADSSTVRFYDNTVTYAVGDLVFDANLSIYYAIQSGSGHAVSNTAYWQSLTNNIYEIANSYAQADLFDIHYIQSGDIVTLVHPNYAPMELRRYGNTNWKFTGISFASTLSPPGSAPTVVVNTPTAGTNVPRKYIVTTLDSFGLQESLPSAASATANNDLTIAGNNNVISWTAVSGAGYYNIYCSINGAYGYIGQVPATSTSFTDRNITPDLTKSLPQIDSPTPLSSSGNYPAAVGYYEQRRIFAGTNNQPQNLWFTQSGTENNLNFNVPSQASDALRVRIAAQKANYIEHIVALQDLLVLTQSTEWRIFTGQGEALSPTTITIKAQSQNGANNVQPAVVNNTAIYASSQGGHLRSAAYSWQNQSYVSTDLCLLATHLFNGYNIVDMAWSRSPYPILWAVNDQGVLLGLTYLPDQQVMAWHQHTTDGLFESICCITEGGFDVLYCVVKRTINDSVTRYIEVMDTAQYNGVLANAFFVDAGLSYNGSPQSTFSGLSHLEGKVVNILADGKVHPQKTVTGGAITLNYTASKVHVGLPIDAKIQTVPAMIPQDSSLGQGRVKGVNHVWARCNDFTGCYAGPDASNLVPVPTLTQDNSGNPTLSNGEFKVNIIPGFNQDGSIVISNPNPTPLTIVDITLEVAIGG